MTAAPTPPLGARIRAAVALLRTTPTTKLRMVAFTAIALLAVLVHLGCMAREVDLTKAEVGVLYAFIAACLGIAGVAQEVKRATVTKATGAAAPAPVAEEG